VNHIDTGRAVSPGGELLPPHHGRSNIDGDGGGVDGVDGDGSGGTSPSRKGAGTETFVPRNWSSIAAVLQNFTGRNADCFRVFALERSYRQKGDVRGGPGGCATLGCGWSLAPLWLSFRLRLVSGKNRRFGLRFVQFQEYFLCNISETQKQQKIGNWHCGILLIG
jgi:hypothetical protein